MYGLFSFLFLICFVAMIVGLIKPGLFNKMLKGNASRKKIFLIFGGAALVFFIIAIATTPGDIGNQKNISGQTDQKAQNNSTATPSTTVQKTEPKTEQQTPPVTAKTLEEKITDAINASLGSKTNTNKPRVVSVEADKYTAALLAEYSYKSSDSVVGLLIKINSDENLTTKLQKGTMNNEATKIAQAVFPLDQTIGDIIIWSQLPVKDQYGNIKDDTAIVYSIARPLFNKINWSNFQHNDLPNLLRSESNIDDRNSYFEKIKF